MINEEKKKEEKSNLENKRVVVTFFETKFFLVWHIGLRSLRVPDIPQ